MGSLPTRSLHHNPKPPAELGVKTTVRIITFVATLLLFLPAATRAQDDAGPDGNELLRRCNAAVKMADGGDLGVDDTLEAMQCLIYLQGFADGYRLATDLQSKGFNQALCLPAEGAETGQLARLVSKWLKENPQHLGESGRMLTLVALTKAFPCK